VPEPPPRTQVLRSIELLEPRVPARVSRELPEPGSERLEGSRLDHIMAQRVLRVGYRPANLPCSFLTPDGDLVGFDVEMAHILAEDLQLSLEFVPFEFEWLDRQLNSGQIDIAMSCIAALPDRFLKASFSRPYLDLRLSLIVRDHERAEFRSMEKLQQRRDLTIAMVGTHYFTSRISAKLPQADFVYLEAAEEFFTRPELGADALLLSAEEGAAYAYRYPQFHVVPVGQNGAVRLPAAYAVPRGDLEMVELVSNWIELKRKSGVIDELYNYWMLGGAAQPRQPRWSIIRDVLHWID
jgi:ABC-type amino acid transport substrate-binding protein